MRVFILDDENGDIGLAVDRHLVGRNVETCARASVERLRELGADSVIVLGWTTSQRLAALRELAPTVPCIVVAPTGIGTAATVEAMRGGAEHVLGPDDLASLRTILDDALARAGARSRRGDDGLGLRNGDGDGFFRRAIETAEEARVASEARCEVVEAQLRQSQKMEAVGRLATGIAHDFNNMLSVILGYGDELIERVAGMPDVRDDIEEIMTAGRRAADLTRQLLMFSRQHVARPIVLDLVELVEGMRKMIERIVGEDVVLEYPRSAFAKAPLVRIDRSGIEQVLLNLVVNARDAMPTGGRLMIAVAEQSDSLALRVRDSGSGMNEATIARAFDPFFTTKEHGKGTGLGLSTAYGIVEQAGGTIHLESKLGGGTTFEVLLPRARASSATLAKSTSPLLTLGTRATILLVEDEDQVRAVTRRALERQGHRVIEARTPIEALDRDPATIDLLLTDVIMPHMSGPELARRLIDARSSLKVLFMSGYSDDNVARHGLSLDSVAYLQKPFTPADLSQKIREVLEMPPPSLATGAA